MLVPAPLPSGTGARIRLLRDLRRDAPPVTSPRRRPDALLLTNSFSSALEARLAGLRPLGYRQDGRGWLLNRALEPPSGGHESARFTRLARALLAARADLGSAPAGLGRSASTIAAADPTGSSGSAAADDADETEEVDKADEADSSGGSARPRLTVAPAAHDAAEALLGRCLGQGQGAHPGSLPGQALPRFACLVPFATGTLKGANKAWPAFPAFAAELARRMPVVVVPDPSAARRRIVLHGDVPSPIDRPTGCHFHTRCPKAIERCRHETPASRDVGGGQVSACHLA